VPAEVSSFALRNKNNVKKCVVGVGSLHEVEIRPGVSDVSAASGRGESQKARELQIDRGLEGFGRRRNW
jgi:hypothetical protein